MRPSESLRLVACLLFGILVPPFLTQCKTSSEASYKDVSYDPAKLKTPSGHGMERDDYPFDEQGNYRKDWVKNNAKGKDSSASPRSDTTPQLASTTTPAGETPAPTTTSYPTYAEASAARESGAYVGPATGAVPATATAGTTAMTLASAPVGETAPVVLASAPAEAAAPSYHKVVSGDTLFAIANRHNTSVADLKRVNGLTGDSIRPGQSLRLP
jgi:LysM repeat protein